MRRLVATWSPVKFIDVKTQWLHDNNNSNNNNDNGKRTIWINQ